MEESFVVMANLSLYFFPCDIGVFLVLASRTRCRSSAWQLPAPIQVAPLLLQPLPLQLHHITSITHQLAVYTHVAFENLYLRVPSSPLHSLEMTGSTTASSTTAMDDDSIPPLLDPTLDVNTLRDIQRLESIYAIKKTVDIYNTAVNHAAALASETICRILDKCDNDLPSVSASSDNSLPFISTSSDDNSPSEITACNVDLATPPLGSLLDEFLRCQSQPTLDSALDILSTGSTAEIEELDLLAPPILIPRRLYHSKAAESITNPSPDSTKDAAVDPALLISQNGTTLNYTQDAFGLNLVAHGGANKSRRILVTDIPPNCPPSRLVHYFATFGQIITCAVLPNTLSRINSDKSILIEYLSPAAALAAVSSSKSSPINGSDLEAPISVECIKTASFPLRKSTSATISAKGVTRTLCIRGLTQDTLSKHLSKLQPATIISKRDVADKKETIIETTSTYIALGLSQTFSRCSCFVPDPTSPLPHIP
ncbi:hypothetical protein VHEMI09380 [[Torrubiella] hemipterigena]|uniref:RRM domain-containing protein n=1 Tax=[Torrubiella] hemipterigena TaxID=1531966 RepID=A0A0A1TRE5_9HYPO|nr:hypothetical protein VHEMI09380 [[Torrubiella] hemipterigena]